MFVRPLFALIYPASLLLPAQLQAAPDFAPSPRQAFEGFVAINPPRVDVPVGALWIDGFGPTGESAGPDNLETVRSLNGLTIDKNLQLSLSLGLFDLLGIDPKARHHYIARFADLSIVRVKDVSRLPGIRGEPRIIEGLKAGSVTISSDSEIGLNGQSIPWLQSKVEGSGTSARTRSYSMEARDMFIAIRVATAELTRSREQSLELRKDGRSARVDDFLIVFGRDQCGAAPNACSPELGIVKINTQTASSVDTRAMQANGEARLPLPIPVSDNRGGLYSTLVVRWIAPCSVRRGEGCGRAARLAVHYEGVRLQSREKVNATSW